MAANSDNAFAMDDAVASTCQSYYMSNVPFTERFTAIPDSFYFRRTFHGDKHNCVKDALKEKFGNGGMQSLSPNERRAYDKNNPKASCRSNHKERGFLSALIRSSIFSPRRMDVTGRQR